ncbi:MAG: hypothetical protein AB1540_17925, partial [Bdellovibrionota bacterium]
MKRKFSAILFLLAFCLSSAESSRATPHCSGLLDQRKLQGLLGEFDHIVSQKELDSGIKFRLFRGWSPAIRFLEENFA